MAPYSILATKQVIFFVGIGLLISLAIILARASRYWGFTTQQKSDEELAKDVHEFGGGVTETQRPVPWLIWLVFVGYFIWAISYVLWNGYFGFGM